MRILVIEDEIKTTQSLRQGLEENNWVVDIAYEGETGKKLIQHVSYDVIVTDIILPGSNGLDLCRWLRQSGVRTPVLMLSALGETDDKVTGLEAGADDYLSKPFEFREFSDLEAADFDMELLGFSDEELDAMNGADVSALDGMPALPDGDREPFQQKTFTLHDEQVSIVDDAITIARTNPLVDTGLNENTNGNALALICSVWLKSNG